MSRSISLHPEFGVNPTVYKCSICCADIGVALLGYNKGKEAPRSAVFPGESCDRCNLHKTIGVILIEVRDGESGQDPYRTGRQFVITKEGFERVFKGPEAKEALAKCVSYVEEKVIKATGIDRMKPTMEA